MTRRGYQLSTPARQTPFITVAEKEKVGPLEENAIPF